MRLPRRTLLLGLGGAGVLVTGSILGLRHLASDSNFRSWVEATVARNMPGVAIPETTMAAFSGAFVEQFPPHRMQRILTAGRGAGHAMLEMAGLQAGTYRSLERHVVTQFLFATDLLDQDDPATAEIAFVGLRSHRECLGRNPFAEFL